MFTITNCKNRKMALEQLCAEIETCCNMSLQVFNELVMNEVSATIGRSPQKQRPWRSERLPYMETCLLQEASSIKTQN